MIDGNLGNRRRARTCRQHNGVRHTASDRRRPPLPIAPHAAKAGGRGRADRSRRSGQLVGHIRLMRLHHLVQPMHQYGHRQVRSQATFEGLTRTLEPYVLQRPLTERLAGYRAAIHAVTSDALFPLDECHPFADLRPLDRRLLSGRTAPNDDDVVSSWACFIDSLPPPLFETCSFNASNASISLGTD